MQFAASRGGSFSGASCVTTTLLPRWVRCAAASNPSPPLLPGPQTIRLFLHGGNRYRWLATARPARCMRLVDPGGGACFQLRGPPLFEKGRCAIDQVWSLANDAFRIRSSLLRGPVECQTLGRQVREYLMQHGNCFQCIITPRRLVVRAKVFYACLLCKLNARTKCAMPPSDLAWVLCVGV